MGNLLVRKGSVSVEMGDTLDRMARRVIEDVHPGLLARIDKDLDKVLVRVRQGWPKGRERGRVHSKDFWEKEVRLSPDFSRVTGHIVNSIAYVRYVKPKLLSGRSGVLIFVRRPVRKLAKALLRDVAKQVKGDLLGGRL